MINSKKSPRPYNTAQLITKSFQLITKFHENCAQFWPIFMLESLNVDSEVRGTTLQKLIRAEKRSVRGFSIENLP